VSTTLAEPLPWPSSTLLRGDGDVLAAVGRLRAHSNGVLAIIGSGELIGSLMPLPRLTDTATAASGVLIATYEPVRNQKGSD